MTCGAGFDCRLCGQPLTTTFLDLGAMPLANSYLPPEPAEEAQHPLHVFVCDACLLVQTHHEVSPTEIFSDYAYFSSFSSTWLTHARQFADDAVQRWGLSPASRVVEVASNDGYLLKNFIAAGIPSLGIEPAANVAETAEAAGVPTRVEFLSQEVGSRLAAEGWRADLVVANNVLAHVPDLNAFVGGLRELLADDGVLSIEFPHLLKLIQEVQFDTIYHEHFSYFSLLAAEAVLGQHELRVFDVETLPTHGGSLRVLACRRTSTRAVGAGLVRVRSDERAAGLHELETYLGFAARVERTKASLRQFLAAAHAANETVVAYGAAAKGNTLLNACGVTADDIAFAVDRNPHKQALLLPGSRIPVRAPEAVREAKPAYVLVLPWNLLDEITDQMSYISEWGGRFVTAIPETRVLG